MQKLRRGFAVLVCTATMLFLTACGGKLPAPPDTYELDGESVPSFNAVLGADNSGTMTTLDTAENQYAYDKLASGGDAVSQYVGSLTSGDDAFSVVDENGAQTAPPDYTAETGTVILARAASESGRILRMEISWTAADCRITLTRPTGEIAGAAADPMTNDEAVAYLQGLKPAELDLPGSSMKGYHIYPVDGMVLVNGAACLKLQICQVDKASGSNRIAGIYLLSADKVHLYRLENDGVTELHAV